jgi:hypothetical protein
MQQVQEEAQGKQPNLAHSTQYTVAPGNTGVLANTSTPYTVATGNTSGNVIYVDTSSPYPGSTSMDNSGGGGFLLLAYLTRGTHLLRLTQVFLHTPHN